SGNMVITNGHDSKKLSIYLAAKPFSTEDKQWWKDDTDESEDVVSSLAIVIIQEHSEHIQNCDHESCVGLYTSPALQPTEIKNDMMDENNQPIIYPCPRNIDLI
ncbi:hypothetical protein KI387_044006, partial [Taxus chinensis]